MIKPNKTYKKNEVPNSEMPKCIITGEPTYRKYQNTFLSREGTEQAKEYQRKVKEYSKETGMDLICTFKMAVSFIIDDYDMIEESKKQILKIQENIKAKQEEKSIDKESE